MSREAFRDRVPAVADSLHAQEKSVVGVDFKVQDHLCRSPLRPRRGMAETGPTGHGI